MHDGSILRFSGLRRLFEDGQIKAAWLVVSAHYYFLQDCRFTIGLCRLMVMQSVYKDLLLMKTTTDRI